MNGDQERRTFGGCLVIPAWAVWAIGWTWLAMSSGAIRSLSTLDPWTTVAALGVFMLWIAVIPMMLFGGIARRGMSEAGRESIDAEERARNVGPLTALAFLVVLVAIAIAVTR